VNTQKLINALVLVRLGQELGSDTALARAIAKLVEEALKLAVS
jgi:hypothetical protein